MGAVRRILPLALALFSTSAFAQEWHKTLEDGKKAAAKSGKPIFLLTIWSPGT